MAFICNDLNLQKKRIILFGIHSIHFFFHKALFAYSVSVFSNIEDIEFLSQHGTRGDKVNLARNSLYVKFDPLVGGRPSMAPYIAQQFVQ